jgi:hypothetical protein
LLSRVWTGSIGRNGKKIEAVAIVCRDVMPVLVTGIHANTGAEKEDVDGRDRPGHDECQLKHLISDEP